MDIFTDFISLRIVKCIKAVQWQNILLYVLLFSGRGATHRRQTMTCLLVGVRRGEARRPPWRYNIGRLGSVLINTLFPDPLVTLYVYAVERGKHNLTTLV